MKRRLLASTSVAVLLGSMASGPSMAQRSEIEGRVEVTSSGVALTLPDG